MSCQNDLFGNDNIVDNEIIDVPKRSRAIRNQVGKFNYRRSKDSSKRCYTCANCFVHVYGKKYYKCVLVGFSHGPATDIRSNNVCDMWTSRNMDK